jgi:hypothetical protein
MNKNARKHNWAGVEVGKSLAITFFRWQNSLKVRFFQDFFQKFNLRQVGQSLFFETKTYICGRYFTKSPLWKHHKSPLSLPFIRIFDTPENISKIIY